jgi:hypothetical protein
MAPGNIMMAPGAIMAPGGAYMAPAPMMMVPQQQQPVYIRVSYLILRTILLGF